MNTYIKMCEGAEEIQKGHKWKDSDKLAYRRCINVRDCNYEELIKHPEYYEMTYGTRKVYENIDIDKPIYLPMLERLQEIAMKLPSLQGRVMKPFWELVDQFNYFIFGDETRKYVSQFESFKEFWFAFVMKEKYNKIWSGKIWIKNN